MDYAQTCPVSGLGKLLLAAEISEFSEGAIREAIGFAKSCSSRLYVITVLETNPEYETIGASVFEKEEAEAVTALESIKERALKEDVSCDTIFRRGSEAWRLIVEEAAERKADMIIIGRRGRRGLAKLIMGEDAAKVIAHAPCKVLVVPRAARIGYRNILVATDGSVHSVAAVAEAAAIAKRCGGSLIALSSWHKEDEQKEAGAHVEAAAEIARREGVPFEALTPEGKSNEAIVEVAGGRGVDLVVMGAYGKTGIRKLLMGSSTEKVIADAACAVLVVKGDEGKA